MDFFYCQCEYFGKTLLQICIRLCIECAVNIFMIDVSQKGLDKHPG
jgi:hypothetical protein